MLAIGHKRSKCCCSIAVEEDGWASLGELGGQINKLSSSFDSRTYGYKKLGELIKAIDMFEIKAIPHEKNTAAKVLYIKLKN